MGTTWTLGYTADHQVLFFGTHLGLPEPPLSLSTLPFLGKAQMLPFPMPGLSLFIVIIIFQRSLHSTSLLLAVVLLTSTFLGPFLLNPFALRLPGLVVI